MKHTTTLSRDRRHTPTALGLTWLSAAVLIATIDWALVPALARPEGPFTELLLLLALVGNTLPLAAAGAIIMFSTGRLRDRLRSAYATWIAAGLLGLLTAPYAYSVVLETFSGPQIGAHPLRVPLMLVATSCLVGATAFYAVIATRTRGLGGAVRLPLGGALIVGAVVSLVVSQTTRPDEYVELHALLGLHALVAGGIGLHEWFRGARGRAWHWRPLPWAIAIVSTSWVIGAVHIAHRAPALAWVIWSETAFARYVTSPWSGFGPEDETDDDALDVPGNDEATDPRVVALRERAKQRPAPNIVIFTIDNVSANRVGAQGYRKNPTTPNIDAMAKRGVLFEHAHSVFPQTRYFLSTLLLGRYVGRFTRHVMPSSYVPLAFTHILKKRAYRIFATGYFEVSSRRAFPADDYAIDEFVYPNERPKHLKQNIEEILDRLSAQAEAAVREDRPLLVWIHLVRPHLQTTEEYDFDASAAFEFGDDKDARYDSAIAASDAVLPRVRSIIDAMPDSREVVWVLGSDHGAGMERYGGKAIKTLFSDHTHVPLIIVAPGIEPRRVSRPVEAPLDITPTVLELAGLDPPEEYQGVSLLPDALGLEVDARPVVLGYNRKRPSKDDAKKPPEWRGILLPPWKLVRREHQLLLTKYEDDPGELVNLVEEHPRVARQLDRMARDILNARLNAYHEALDEDSAK